MKNKLSDLNNHLFAQLERLSDEDLTADELAKEIDRSKAINSIANTVVDNARLVFDVVKARDDGLIHNAPEVMGLEQK